MDDPHPDIRRALENDHPEQAVKITKELLKNVKNLPLTIAVTGESGSGKSSLVNTLRGVEQDDPRAAPTGVVETTMEPTKYIHPDFPTVSVWDLPGIGTMKMMADKYLHHVGFQKYDVFIIVSSGRFREHDAKLGMEIKKMDKKFYFVRSKVDEDMYNEKMKLKSRFNRAKTLREIHDDCMKGLKSQGVESPQVFLLSSFEPDKYDFSKLEETMEGEMSMHQRESLHRTVLSYNEKIIHKKKQDLEGSISGLVTGSVFGGLLLGLSLIINDKIVENFAANCQTKLGLTEQTLEKISRESNVSVRELKNAMNLSLSPSQAEINAYSAAAAFNVAVIPTMMIVSPISVSGRLRNVLNVTTQDAQNVMKKALGLF